MPFGATTTLACVGTLRPRDFFVRLGTGIGAGADGLDERIARVTVPEDGRDDVEVMDCPVIIEDSTMGVVKADIRSA